MPLTRSMTQAGNDQLSEPLPPTRRTSRATEEDVWPLAWPQDGVLPHRRQEEDMQNITAAMSEGMDPIRSSVELRHRHGPGSSASSVKTRSSIKSRTQRTLEKEEQAARLREQKRQNDLKRAQAEAEDARIADELHLLELRSQVAEEDEENYFEEVQSIVAPNSVHDWMKNAATYTQNPKTNDVENVTRTSIYENEQHAPRIEVDVCNDRNKQSTIHQEKCIKNENSSVEMLRQISVMFSESLKSVQQNRHEDNSGFMARQCAGAKDLPDFYGDPEDWTSFIQRFDTSTNLCRFSHDENLLRLQKCLKGKARESVSSMISAGCHPTEIIRVLEKRFGRPELVFKGMMEKVKYTSSLAEGDFNGIVEFSTVVKNLCATAKSLKLQAYLTSPQLLEELKRKLPSNLQMDWGKYMVKIHRIADICDFSDFLDEISDALVLVCEALPVRRKQRAEHGHGQVMIVNEVNGCVLSCKDKHPLSACPRFKKMNTDDRWEVVKKNRTCFTCLGRNHQTLTCSKKKKCRLDGCIRLHHPLLHAIAGKGKQQLEPKEDKVTHENKPNEPGTSRVLGVVSQPHAPIEHVLMKIVPVELTGPTGSILANAFLDDGSSLTILDEDVANQLRLDGPSKPLNLAWQGGRTDWDQFSISVSLTIRGIDEDQEYVMTDVRTKKNLNLPVQPLSNYKSIRKWKHLEAVPFPEVLPTRSVIVIGEDNIQLMISRKFAEGPSTTPVASWTYLGWVIHGPCGRPLVTKLSHVSMINIEHADPDQALHELVKEQFRLESLGIVNCPNIPMSASNRRAEKLMEKYCTKVGNRWIAPMLWKTDDVELPDNWVLAKKRLQLLERQMDKDDTFAELYHKKIEEYLEKGFCHKLNSEELKRNSKRVYYLPHFGTTNPNKPEKIRLAFDCAAKYKGSSLNDVLIQGRDLMSPLMNVLMKFREREIAFSGDIRDMFHMAEIRQEDTPTLRFLWRGKDRRSSPDVYQMDVMVFGAVSSPYQAQWIKNRNANDFVEEFPEAVDAIHNRHYVDDYLDSCSTAEKAIKKIMEVREIHQQGGFEIRGWQCNDADVLKIVAPGEQQTAESVLLTDDKIERVLGLHWKPKDDTFTFKTSFNKVNPQIITGANIPTKRQLLQLVMSLFDPLGFIGHLTARGRMLLQTVWKSGIGWDESIIGVAKEKWELFLAQIVKITDVRISRCFAPRISSAVNIQVHTFCDASQQAFGAVTYLRTIGSDGTVNVNIVISKTRVTPIKCISIPRLELEAALVGARQTKFVRTMFGFKINSTTLWTDSRNVLYWLRAENPSKFKMYAAYRIGEILDLTNVSEWRWVPTADNVADDCTRDGIAADLLPSSRWFNSFIAEERGVPKVENYSCWIRLVRVTAWWLRYLGNVRKRKEDRLLSKCLSVAEIKNAVSYWVKRVQIESFGEELNCMINGLKLNSHSKLINLSPTLIDEIIRIDSRLIDASDLSNETKFPVILDKKHPWTSLLVMWYHKVNGHHGYDKICNELRQSYWIIGMKAAVKKASKDCLDCQMRRAKQIVPKMAALPGIRIRRPSRPFTYVGVDYFGPLDIVHGRKHEKRYGVLFTCLSIRAVHLEVAHSLSTDDFLMALERFICTRGEPTELWSDNGTNFKGAEKELKKSLMEINQHKITDKLATRGIVWNFIPPSAPHMGGVWERLVRSVKTAMNITLKNRILTDPLLSTVLAEAMAAVNSRPITVVSEDWSDQEAITPNSFLIGTSSIKQTPGDYDDQDLCSRKRWRKARALSNQFWNRWTKEYLPSLALRTKWRRDTPDVKIGDLVFLADTNELTQQWQKGLVTNTYPGRDGHPRVVDVKTAKGVYKRPVVKLFRIPEFTSSRDSAQLSHGKGYVPEENKPRR